MPGILNDTDSESEFTDDSSNDSSSLNLPRQPMAPTKKWDAFQIKPPEVDSGSAAAMVWVRRFEKLMLIMAYIFAFVFIFTAAVVGKGVTFFMISQVTPRNPVILPFCNEGNDVVDQTKEYQVERDRDKYPREVEVEQVAWVWTLIFAFCFPEVLTFLRAIKVILFKHWFLPQFRHFSFVLLMETLHTIGMATLIFLGLPQLDVIRAIALTNCVALIPGILLAMSREKDEKHRSIKIGIDTFAILCQLSGVLLWPILQWTGYYESNGTDVGSAWALPLGLILASFGWWESFVAEKSPVPLIHWMWTVKMKMVSETRYFTYLWISVIKIGIFFMAAWIIVSFNGVLTQGESLNLFNYFSESFGVHGFNVTEIQDKLIGDIFSNADADEARVMADVNTWSNVPLQVLLIQMGCTYGAYIGAKWACKVQIQGFSYSVPLCSTVPMCITLLLAACGAKAEDKCAFHEVVPDYLFYQCPAVGDYFDFLWQEQMWLWFLWLVSQMWITLHIWYPKSTRLAATEEMFATPMYNSIMIDQSLVLNRRRDGQNDFSVEDLRDDMQEEQKNKFYESLHNDYEFNTEEYQRRNDPNKVRASDRITKIYGCATMWHETKDEIMEMLKSVFRIDMDYSTRRLAVKYLQTFDPDYYEWETHIFFDDAFELGNNDEDEQIVNQFVKKLVSCMDEAGSFVHGQNIKVKAPKKYPTPYGGRLVWTLPGKTKIVCHLKDKAKIRHKKRWSQCMYMYYLLGFKLMELPIPDERKEIMAENTYLLALDGDIDFQPEAITRLVDLMKKNRNLGAACGRIHPTGSGFMQWYQRFEYAIGHWLQKATEHVMGCVLCSPGCFSLMRAKALMEDNVMKMYTTKSEKARDFVQYDQGEDRWLCTLLLQRGWRVEYSAASDAYTACPEGFNEFFNQRRRWMPSTIANIFDVLADYKNVTKVNEDISIFYIVYQMMLMVGTVVGPGTIFLMLVGAFTAAFAISNWDSFLLNLVPIMLFMIVCFTLNSKIQLFMAQILSAVYALVMMAVLVGIMLQIKEDGVLAPTTLSIFLVGGSFILAAIVHPQEFWCLPYGIIYYVTIPSMYLLLVIYSIFNLNDVSWGTRDVPKKKTKQELEDEKKKEEEMKQAAKKKKKEGSLLSFLYQQGDKKEKGGLEFNLANLFKCMCFTHEDESDPKKQLVQIAASMEEVTTRLGKIEGAISSGGGGGSNFGFRRRSSSGRRATRGSIMGGGMPAPLQDVAEDEVGSEVDGGSLHLSAQLPSESESSSNEEEKIQRDDLANPYWIEDRDLKNGKIDFLPGVELQFWKDLIAKYLEPLMKDVEKEKRQAEELKTLRNQMVFSFFMLNAIFVVVVFLLQQKKDLLFIRWPLGAKVNVTYNMDNDNPKVEVIKTYLELEPIGLVFVLFFAVVLIIQIIGMLFHRWGTISQIISTTRLAFCEKKSKDTTVAGDLNKNALLFTEALTRKESKEKPESKFAKGAVGRRNTVHNLLKQQQNKDQEEKPMNLEKRFRKRLMSLRHEDMMQSDNAALRRLSMRRGTMTEIENRTSAFFAGERRRSTMRRMSMMSATRDMSSDEDSVGDSDYDDDYSGSGLDSLHLEAVDDYSEGSEEGGEAVTSM